MRLFNKAKVLIAPKQNRVGKKLKRFVLGLCGSLLILAMLINGYYQYLDIRQDTVLLLRSHAQSIALNNTAAITFDDVQAARDNLQTTSNIDGLTFAAIYKTDLRLFAQYPQDVTFPLPRVSGLGEHRFIEHYLLLKQEIFLGGESIAFVLLKFDMRQAYQRLYEHIYINLLITAILLLILFFSLQRFEKTFSRPIQQLHQAAQYASAGDYSVRVTKTSDDELGDLANIFNQMLEQVQTRDRQLADTAKNLDKRVQERTLQLESAKLSAEKATKAKSQFLATMSHEIRTPLNGVVGMASLLLNTPLNHEQQEYAKTISSSSDILLTIINDVLDFSKIEAGRMTLESSDFNLRQALYDLLNIQRLAALEKGIYLQCDFEAQVPEVIIGDSARLCQIIMNLISNAIKFTREGGVFLHIKADILSKNRCFLNLEVIDTGLGISTQKLDKVFLEFLQEDSSTTRNYGGTGLGLAISKKLALLMQGNISAISEQGRGSTFKLSLPCQYVSDQSEKDNSINRDEIQQLKVLLLGERIEKFALNQQWLSDFQIDYCYAHDEQGFKQYLKEHSFDLILLDDVIGLSNCESLIEDMVSEQREKPHCILLLSHLLKENGHELVDKGFDGFLYRPIFKPQFLLLLQNVYWQRHQETERHFLRAFSLDQDHHQNNNLLANKRVLLAEDNQVNQIVSEKMLSAMGATVDIANNGLEAVRMWTDFPYDLIIMDCMMPEMDGYEASREIRRLEDSHSHIPIVALTANALAGEKQTCLDAGMDGFITKPIRSETLYEALDYFFSQNNNGIKE
ncbi:MAG: response regulator [Pseudomonadales bacterium]|nr:response regulator [Pseudomonadales bacterium]